MLLTLLLALFLSFYLAVFFQEKKHTNSLIFALLLFLVFAITLSLYYPPITTSDYKYYAQSYNYEFSNSFLFKDVLVSLQYALISLFVETKLEVIRIMYFLLKSYYLLFTIWLVFSKIEAYKKILFFSITYFLCSSVLLRNGPCYLLVFVGTYYLLREQKRYYLTSIIATLFHFSGVFSFIMYVKLKFNREFILYAFIVLVSLLVLINFEIIDISLFTKKINTYSSIQKEVNWYHKIWFVFIIGTIIFSFFENKQIAFKSNILVLVFLYLLVLFINVVPSFRVSLYLLIVYCNIPVVNPKIKLWIPKINLLSLSLVLVFIISFLKTHDADLYSFMLN